MHSSDSARVIEFNERVYPSVLALLPTTLLTPSVALVTLPFLDAWIAVLIGLSATVSALALALINAPVVRLSAESGEQVLRVGQAAIEKRYISKITLIEPAGKRAALSTGLNALAFVRIQSGVTGLVRVDINDVSDPTPYWVFSARKGAELKKALEA